MSASDSTSLPPTYAAKLSVHVPVQCSTVQKAGANKPFSGIRASRGGFLRRLGPGSGFGDTPITTATAHRYLNDVTNLIN